MDAHRLRSVIDTLVAEHARLGLDAGLAKLIQALEACIKQPSCASDEKFRGVLTELLTGLRSARTNELVESDRRILLEMRGERYTGNGLAERLLAVANERPFLAARAAEKYVELADEVQAYLGACIGVQGAMARLGIEPAALARDEYELGILLPDGIVQGDLDRLLAELKDWSGVVKDLVGVFSEQVPRTGLRTFTTRRFELAVAVDRDAALALGTIIAAVHEMFAKTTAHRTRAEALEHEGYPPEIVTAMQGHESAIVQSSMKALQEMLSTRHARKSARRRDVEKTLDRCLRFVAKRLRDGVELELLGPTAEETVPAADASLPHQVRAAMRSAQSAAPRPEPVTPAPEPSSAEQLEPAGTQDREAA